MKRSKVALLMWLAFSVFRVNAAIALMEDGYHVYPGDSIQEALQKASENTTNKIVRVHAGEYRPDNKGQALIWLNRKHDGIRVEAVGEVTLTAANPALAARSEASFPAVVNHVVYVGDGISSNTVLKGFRITGANNFVSRDQTQEMEPNRMIPKNL